MIDAESAPSGSTIVEQQGAVARAIITIATLNNSPDWELGIRVSDAIMALIESCSPLWDDETYARIRFEFLNSRLLLLFRTHDEYFLGLVEEFIAATETIDYENLAHHRLSALAHKVSAIGRLNYRDALPYDDEIERLVAERPWLASTDPYQQYLRAIVIIARAENDERMIRSVERRLNAFLSNPDVSESSRRKARTSTLLYFLDIFESREELERRLAMLTDLESTPGMNPGSLLWHRAILLFEIGEVRQVVAIMNDVIARMRDHGFRRSLFQGRLLLLCARTVLGESMAVIENEMRSIVEEAPPEFQKMLGNSICSHLLEVALLRGEREWSVRIFDEFEPSAQRIFADYRIIRGIAKGEFPKLLPEQMTQPVLQKLVECYLDHPRDRQEIIDVARQSLGTQFIRFESLTVVRSTLEVIKRIEVDEPELRLVEELGADIDRSIVACLEWLSEREIHPCIESFVTEFGSMVDPGVLAPWRERLEAREKVLQKSSSASQGEERIRLSMLGTIEIVKQDGETIRPRGARLRTLLGLMVADRMLDKPLSSREFYLLAAGEEDIDRARNTVHVAMHRLRESVGLDEAFTAVEKPRLNLDLFEVDLLEARRLLREGDVAARNGAWVRASGAVGTALALTRNEVPFPSLYDTFFEAAREDFENELRDTVLRVARGLLDEDDPASAQEILARAFELLPDDEEVSSLLYMSLTRLGRRTEAERVRMRSAEIGGD
jgi:DNA-binding SARP family transcriptional activator